MQTATTRSATVSLAFVAVAEVTGLSCLAAALFFSALPGVGIATPASLPLRAVLLVFATGQILAGLAVWRRRQPLSSVVLTAFGLFCFSRSAFVVAVPTAASITSEIFLLLLWGGYALILACEASDCRLALRLTLFLVAAALLTQALGTALGNPLLLVVGAGCGLLGALAAGLTAVDRSARLRAELSA